MVNVPSPLVGAGALELGAEELLVSLADLLSLPLLLPQALRASAAVPRTAAVRQARVGRVI
jgi:hypothetical protein